MTRWGGLAIVCYAKHGFVTDLGDAPLPLVAHDDTDRATVVDVLPRYGVWKHTGRKFEVVFTTDDYAAACAEAEK